MCENKRISEEDYTEHHESREDLYMTNEHVPYFQCTSCPEHFPADELLFIGHDRLCPECAEAADVFRCGYCGIVFEMSDKCPECGWSRK